MTLNIDALKSQLAAKITAIDTSTDANELLLLSASVANVTTDNIVAVDTANDLPDLQTGLTTFPFPSGSIFYVRSLQVLVISSRSRWIGFDGRVLRSDLPTLVTYGWGNNSGGQLGDGTTTTFGTGRSSPVTVIGGITAWSQVSGGGNHSLGVTNTGIAYAWGSNGNAQLGTGNTTNTSSPVTVVGGITNWSQVSGGTIHSLGVTNTGIAYAWGGNNRGQIGDGQFGSTGRSSPVTVAGGITTWSQLSAGNEHSLGLTSAGIAYAWGYNATGCLGDNTTTERNSPVTVIGGITNWSQLSAGSLHSLGVTNTGIAYAWGGNSSFQLGTGNSTSRSSPVTVIGGITNWSQVSAGLSHSLGLTSAGIAYAWGSGSSGRLGDGTQNTKSSPVTVIGGITNWSQVSTHCSGSHSLGLTSTGIAYAWGFNGYGQLGAGNTTGTSSPVTVVGGITNWSQVSGGNGHSLALSLT